MKLLYWRFPLKQLYWFSWVCTIRENGHKSQKLKLTEYLAWRPTTLVAICHSGWWCLTHCAAALICLPTVDIKEADVQEKPLLSRDTGTDFTKQILQQVNCRIPCSSSRLVCTALGQLCCSNCSISSNLTQRCFGCYRCYPGVN